MKKTVFLLLTVFITLQSINAQVTTTPRARYLNLSFEKQKLKHEDGFSINSDYAAAVTLGRTFYLHKTPIANMIRIGLDWSYFDLNFAGYSQDNPDYDDYYEDEDEKLKMYKLEAGMQFGPSVTVTPVNGLNISAYFRYTPSFSGIYDDYMEEFAYGYASFFNTGVSISYKAISIGIEQRWGSRKYKFGDDDEDDYYYEDESIEQKLKTSGPRFYIGLRF